MSKKTLLNSIYSVFLVLTLVITTFLSPEPSWAKRPPEIRNQDDLNISKDMHGQDLSGMEFVKYDLRGIDFSEANLNGAVFNNSKLNNADMHGANLQDSLAYASEFEGTDLSNVNFTNSLLMESTFTNSNIEGADFTDAVLSRIQQKQLCEMAKGTNSNTGISTSYSLGC